MRIIKYKSSNSEYIDFKILAALALGELPPSEPTNSVPIKHSITCKSRASILFPRELAGILFAPVMKYKISLNLQRLTAMLFVLSNSLYNAANSPVSSLEIALFISGILPIVATISSSLICKVFVLSTGK